MYAGRSLAVFKMALVRVVELTDHSPLFRQVEEVESGSDEEGTKRTRRKVVFGAAEPADDDVDEDEDDGEAGVDSDDDAGEGDYGGWSVEGLEQGESDEDEEEGEDTSSNQNEVGKTALAWKTNLAQKAAEV